MYDDRFFPFYTAYANPVFYGGEQIQEQEFALMQSYYPEAADRIREKVEKECRLLDYEGSRLYDEYPDKFMLHQLCRQIRAQVESEMKAQGVPDGFLDELIQILLARRYVEDDADGTDIISAGKTFTFTSDEMETFMCIRSEVVL